MALSSLPPELLIDIAALSRPHGLESFALTSKQLYSVAKPLIAEHNYNKRVYGHFKFHEPDGRREQEHGIRSAPQLLARISHKPLICEYMIDADFRLRQTSYKNEDEASAVRNLVKSSRYLAEAEQDFDEWCDGIINDEDPENEVTDWATTFLLTLLPNARSIGLPESWNSSTCEPQSATGRVLRLLIEKANYKKTHEPALGRLSMVKPTWESGLQNNKPLIVITPFLGLKTLEELYFGSGGSDVLDGSGWVNSEDVWECHKSFYYGSGSQIKKLELPGTVMHHLICKTFFGGMSSLRSLELEIVERDNGEGEDWDADDFVKNLMDNVGDTIEYLSLSVGWPFDSENMFPLKSSMKRFKNLRHLELDTRLFHRLRDFQDDIPEDDWGYDNVPRLVDLLPASLSKFTLLCHEREEDMKCLGDLFKDFTCSERKFQLPQLKEVKVIHVPSPRVSRQESYVPSLQVPESVKKSISLEQVYFDIKLRCQDLEFVEEWGRHWSDLRWA